MVHRSRREIFRETLTAWVSAARAKLGGALAPLPAASVGGARAQAHAQDAKAPLTAAQVERAIRFGVAYLKQQQKPDGSWPNPGYHHQHTVGPTSLVVHALIVAGEPVDSPPVAAGLRFLEKFTPEEVDGTYSVGLQTIVFAEVDPAKYAVRIASNVAWLERAQVKAGDNNPGWPGSWAHTSDKTRRGDSSSTQFALLGLNAAARVGVPIRQDVWERSRTFLTQGQRFDGGWPYYPSVANSTSSASMTCAGISGLIITGQRLVQSQERLVDGAVRGCGKTSMHPGLRRGLDWMAAHFSVNENPGSAFFRQWKHYYLYGMERVGRFAGLRYIGSHDWYREGAEELVATQDVLLGSWTGVAVEHESILATSFAVLFLATGRSPVLVNKLRHGPGDDWDNDIDDIRNLVGKVSDEWKHTLTWQAVDPARATVEDMLQAPVAYFNGHEAPEFSPEAKQTLRGFVEQGGFILAEACCGSERFDKGFRALIQELFPGDGAALHPLAEDHAVWRARHVLSPGVHPLWGVDHGCRTVVIYSPEDLSCYWNQMEAQPAEPAVIKAVRVGENIIDYATGRELPADKLAVREVKDFKAELPKRGALHIAKLRHAGDWNVAPLAIPSLTTSLKARLGLDVVVSHKELFLNDPNLANYPLVYLHGRAPFAFSKAEIDLLRKHFDPGGGTLFADAACGSPAFDASFRKLVAAVFPSNPLAPIPTTDALNSAKTGYDLSDVQFTRASGGGRGFPQLEGVMIDGHWAVIYSKLDVGCALERHSGIDCKGYTPESALKIAANIVIYATLP